MIEVQIFSHWNTLTSDPLGEVPLFRPYPAAISTWRNISVHVMGFRDLFQKFRIRFWPSTYKKTSQLDWISRGIFISLLAQRTSPSTNIVYIVNGKISEHIKQVLNLLNTGSKKLIMIEISTLNYARILLLSKIKCNVYNYSWLLSRYAVAHCLKEEQTVILKYII